ncbi:acyl-CoA desaturase, partial [Dietzia kunjamensis]
MAISDVGEYAHLSSDQIEELGRELDAVRAEVIASRGERDYCYIHSIIKLQRGLEFGARALLYFGARNRTVWALGTGTLAVAKILENMELGHNIMHGQWDWMNDPEIHSTNWEWDLVGSSADWKHTHNYLHHKYTNIVGVDDDVGFGVLRVTRDIPWEPRFAGNVLVNAVLMLGFEWGIGLQAVDTSDAFDPEASPADRRRARAFLRKAGQQILKDYVLFPVLAGPSGRQALTATITANIIRNIWTNAVIFCGHFPDGAEKFTMDDIENETQAEWYLRQMLGSANLDGGPAMNLMSGNLSFQIE